MQLFIDHLTHYRHDVELKFSTQYLRPTPRSTSRQTRTGRPLNLPDGVPVTTSDSWGNVIPALPLANPLKE
ncbi:transglutaminase family protein, partial [Klebsiella pneumoniae]|nr:transglutaminase family protein [Klebsiella pneumoniae]